MGLLEAKEESRARASCINSELTNHLSNRRVLFMDRKNGSPEKGLEGSLTSALHAADNELGQILHEVDKISTY